VSLPLDGSLPQLVLPVLDGFQCTDCGHKTINRLVMRQHCNARHAKQCLRDEKLFGAVRLQSWFREKRARYWVVDETRLSRDVNTSSGSGSDTTIKAEIIEWIEKEAGQYESSSIAMEVDQWLRYMGWEEVLAGLKHNLVTTAAFTSTATAAEPELGRVLESWERILQRSLGTLTAMGNYKDILKWWALPKNKVASQRPFE